MAEGIARFGGVAVGNSTEIAKDLAEFDDDKDGIVEQAVANRLPFVKITSVAAGLTKGLTEAANPADYLSERVSAGVWRGVIIFASTVIGGAVAGTLAPAAALVLAGIATLVVHEASARYGREPTMRLPYQQIDHFAD